MMKRSLLRPRSVFATALAAALGVAASLSAYADVAPPEHKVKAAFIYNFVRFVEWPPVTAGTPIRVGVVGSDAIVSTVHEALDGRSVGDRPITVDRVMREEDAKAHDVLYVAGNNADLARRYVVASQGHSVLTVTECDRFLAVGSLVNFFFSDDTVRFAVNASELEKSPIKMSSQMLQFAAMVRPEKS